MKLEEIQVYYGPQEYIETCGCGKKHTIRTQEDNYPEYYTYAYVLCDCGDYVKFELPVN